MRRTVVACALAVVGLLAAPHASGIGVERGRADAFVRPASRDAQRPSSARNEELAMSVAVDRRSVRFPGIERLTVTVRLETADLPLRFNLNFRASGFIARRAGVSVPEGMTLSPVGLPTIRGAGTFESAATTSGFIWCGAPGRAGHGYDSSDVQPLVSMPANAEAVVALTYRGGDHAPWPGLPHRVRVTATPRAVRPRENVLRAPLTAWTPPVPVHGSTGTRITLDTSPRSSPLGTGRVRRARLGSTIKISGHTAPALVRAKVQLLVVPPRARRQVKLAAVRTDRRGRFSYRYTPRTPGVYQIAAESPAGPRRVADHSCPVSIDMRR